MATSTNQNLQQQLFEHLMAVVRQTSEEASTTDDSPLALVTAEFFANNWADACDGILQKTRLLRMYPEWAAAPRAFRFELDRPYKRKTGPAAPVELCPGPIHGMIRYRADLFASPGLPYIAVQIDPTLSFFHPNCSRQRGSLVCLGELPESMFPYPLDLLIETRLYPILTYQDRRPSHPFDLEAAQWFALNPEAMEGLEPVPPLY